MHPAPSVIFFSVFSGAGFGFLAWLGLGFPAHMGLQAFFLYFIGYALAIGGLLSSVFHLANKKNAIKAFREWRSSWLSREGILAIIALLVIAIEAIARIFFAAHLAFIGALGSSLAMMTVFTTAMIYTQLKSVPRWNTPLTPALFLHFAISGGAIMAGLPLIASIGLLVLALIQFLHWQFGDQAFAGRGNSIEAATGLGSLGKIRQWEAPHSEENYLLKEMGFEIARKHAQKLRALAIVLGVILPILTFWLFQDGWIGIALAGLLHMLGALISRWLFFGEAKHVMALYYDR